MLKVSVAYINSSTVANKTDSNFEDDLSVLNTKAIDVIFTLDISSTII